MTEPVTKLPRPPLGFNLPTISGSLASHLMDVAAGMAKLNEQYSVLKHQVHYGKDIGWGTGPMRTTANKLAKDLQWVEHARGEIHQDDA